MKAFSKRVVINLFSHRIALRRHNGSQARRSCVNVQLTRLLLSIALLFGPIALSYAADVAAFKISSQTFADRMNANLTRLNIPLQLTINLEEGHSTDAFQHIFNEHVGLIGSAEKQNHQLTGIVLFSGSAESVETTTQNLQIVTAAFSALLGENNVESREVTEMMFGLLQDSRTSEKGIRQVENIRFTATTSEDADIIFTAEPVL